MHRLIVWYTFKLKKETSRKQKTNKQTNYTVVIIKIYFTHYMKCVQSTMNVFQLPDTMFQL